MIIADSIKSLSKHYFETLKKYKFYSTIDQDKDDIIDYIKQRLIEYDTINKNYIVKDWPSEEDFKNSYAIYRCTSAELIQWCYLLINVNAVKKANDNEIVQLKNIFDANKQSYKPDRCDWMKTFYTQVTSNGDVCSPSQILNWYYAFNLSDFEVLSVQAAYMFNKYNCDNQKLVNNWIKVFSEKLDQSNPYSEENPEARLNPFIAHKYCVAFSFIPVDDAINYWIEFRDDIDQAMEKHYLSVWNKNIEEF